MFSSIRHPAWTFAYWHQPQSGSHPRETFTSDQPDRNASFDDPFENPTEHVAFAKPLAHFAVVVRHK
jgi:hypothetical protein